MNKGKKSLFYKSSLTEILGLCRPTRKKSRSNYFKPNPKPSTTHPKHSQEPSLQRPLRKRRSSLAAPNLDNVLSIKSKPLIEAWEKFPGQQSTLIKFSLTSETVKKCQIHSTPKSIQIRNLTDFPFSKIEGW